MVDLIRNKYPEIRNKFDLVIGQYVIYNEKLKLAAGEKPFRLFYTVIKTMLPHHIPDQGKVRTQISTQITQYDQNLTFKKPFICAAADKKFKKPHLEKNSTLKWHMGWGV